MQEKQECLKALKCGFYMYQLSRRIQSTYLEAGSSEISQTSIRSRVSSPMQRVIRYCVVKETQDKDHRANASPRYASSAGIDGDKSVEILKMRVMVFPY